MKVILLCDVKGTGKKDDVLTISDGYARNFLLPRKWAVEASPSAVKEIERKRATQEKLEQEHKAAALEQAAALRGKEIVIVAKCGDKGRLYGSVTGQEIAQALKEQHGVEIDKRKIEVAEAIRTVGEYEAQITVYAGVKAQMKLSVLAAQ